MTIGQEKIKEILSLYKIRFGEIQKAFNNDYKKIVSECNEFEKLTEEVVLKFSSEPLITNDAVTGRTLCDDKQWNEYKDEQKKAEKNGPWKKGSLSISDSELGNVLFSGRFRDVKAYTLGRSPNKEPFESALDVSRKKTLYCMFSILKGDKLNSDEWTVVLSEGKHAIVFAGQRRTLAHMLLGDTYLNTEKHIKFKDGDTNG